MKPNTQINPRPYAAFYFAVFAAIFNLTAKWLLFVFKASILLPLYSSTMLAVLLGAVFGHLFGKKLVGHKTTLNLFFIGTLIALAMIPFYSLGLQLIYYFHNHAMYLQLHHWQDYLVLYGVMVLFFTLVAGIWLILLTGIAAVHFNRRFFPGASRFEHKP